MRPTDQVLSPSEAAARLGVSAKALRLYEERGLVTPLRTAAGWRAYGPEQMARAGEIAAFRALGLSLSQVARVLDGDPRGLEAALAAHQASLLARSSELVTLAAKVGDLRARLAEGQALDATQLSDLLPNRPAIAFDLPWPWGGERFEFHDVRPLTWLVGPLGSGKTRLARRLAEAWPGARFLGLDRQADEAAVGAGLDADAELKARVERAFTWLREDGATESIALTALLAGLEADGPTALVVDLVEDGLDEATQRALAAFLRRRAQPCRPLVLMTRSSAILDLAAVEPDEAILFCPANHSPPLRVAPYPGVAGYEAVANCLAAPDVRARTAGVIAWRPDGRPEAAA
ncbi:MAG: MerR family transcriptional regulator [Proteobacteria bacterium]|nr:MerR family transcriptional regulator [Pseudomonadota bacterium]